VKDNLSSEFIFEQENAIKEYYRSVESVYTHTHAHVASAFQLHVQIHRCIKDSA